MKNRAPIAAVSLRGLFYRPWQSFVILAAFVFNSFGPLPIARADEFRLPAPGVMVHLSPPLDPPMLKGIKVHPDNPFRFDFILDKGDSQLSNAQLKDESSKLIKYFLASLTIPEKDLWVNLSPYEKDRIIPQSFGLTEMGRDLLAEDYILKQITASLIYPEDEIGKKFWKRIYEEAAKKFGTTNVPVNTFNKVWIVPEKAVVYENAKAGTAYVVESKLKVMLEQDYLSLEKHEGSSAPLQIKDTNQLGSQIVREIVIPELTKEVNENKNFAQLRQVYNSLILATWYKKKIKDSILEQVYADKNKVAGVNIDDPQEKAKIYQRYLQAFKKGVYNYIKEEIDPLTQETIPRKYFSGGAFLVLVQKGEETNFRISPNFEITSNESIINRAMISPDRSLLIEENTETVNAAMFSANSKIDGLQAVLQAVGELEQRYVRLLYEINDVENTQEVILLKNQLNNDYNALIQEINRYRNALLLRGTLTKGIFNQYAQELQKIHKTVSDDLLIYTDWYWPHSRIGKKAYALNHQKAEEVWQEWQNDPEHKKLAGLKERYDRVDSEQIAIGAMIEQSLKEILSKQFSVSARQLNRRFQTILYTQTLMSQVKNGELTEQQAEQFFKNFVFTPEDFKKYVNNDFFKRVPENVLQAIATKGLVNANQLQQINDMVASELAGSLKVVRLSTILKRKLKVAALVPLAVIAADQHIGLHKTMEVNNQNNTKQASVQAAEALSRPVETLPQGSMHDLMELSHVTKPVTEPKVENKVERQGQNVQATKEQNEEQIAQLDAQIQSNNQTINQAEQKVEAPFEGLQKAAEKKNVIKSTGSSEQIDPAKQVWHKPSADNTPVPTPSAPSIAVPEFIRSLAVRLFPNVSLPEGIIKFLTPFLDNTPGPRTQQVTQGISSLEEQFARNVPIAQVQGNFHYLTEAVYSNFDPVTGKFFPQTPQTSLWQMTNESTSEFVIISSHGKKEFHALVPPNYKIVSLETQKNIGTGKVMYDSNNHSWSLFFNGDPGYVRLGVKPASANERGSSKALQIVDSKGNPIGDDAFRNQMKKDMPSDLWNFLEKHKNDPIEQRREIRDQLIKLPWFYYTTNPLLSSSFSSSNSLLKSIFENMAGKCDGLTVKNMIISRMLDLTDARAHIGYMVTGTFVSGIDSHAWDEIGNEIMESTAYASKISPFYEREGVTTQEQRQEMNFIHDVHVPSIHIRMKADLENIEHALVKKSLEEDNKVLSSNTQAQPQSPSSSKVFLEANDSKVLAYYQLLTDDYRRKLEILRGNTLTSQEAQELETWLKNINFEENFYDKYQYMAGGHFLNAVADLLQTRGFGNGQLKSQVFERILNFGIHKGWDPNRIIEPLPYPITVDVDRKTQLVYEQRGTVLYIIDTLSKEEIPVPEGAHLVTFADGLYVFEKEGIPRLDSKGFAVDSNGHKQFPVGYSPDTQNQYILTGKNAGKFAGSWSGQEVKLYHNYPNGTDWLLYIMNSRKDILDQKRGLIQESLFSNLWIGPSVQEAFGKPMISGYPDSFEEGAYFAQGKSMIPYRNDNTIFQSYAGSLARYLHIDGLSFDAQKMKAPHRNLFVLQDGRIVFIGVGRDGQMRFYGDGVPDSLKAYSFQYKENIGIEFKEFSKGRWCVIVPRDYGQYGYFGNIDDDILYYTRDTQENIQISQIFESPDGKLGVASTVEGQWFKSLSWQRVLEEEEEIARKENSKSRIKSISTPIFFDKIGATWIAKVVEVKDRMSPGGRIILSETQEKWVGSETGKKIIDDYNLNVRNPSGHLRFTDFVDFKMDENGRWIARVSILVPKTDGTEENADVPIGPLVSMEPPLGQITRVFDIEILKNGEWFAVASTTTQGNHLIGSWARNRKIPNDTVYSGEGGASVVFAYDENGQKDPNNYIINYSHYKDNSYVDSELYGPIAEKLGIARKKFFMTRIAGDDQEIDVNVWINKDTMQSLPLTRTFSERMEALWGLGRPEAVDSIPSERVDLLWQNFDKLAQKNPLNNSAEFESSGRTLSKIFTFLEKHTDGSDRYYDAHQVEDVVRRNKKFLARAIIDEWRMSSQHWGGIYGQLSDTFYKYGLNYLTFEVLTEIHDQFKQAPSGIDEYKGFVAKRIGQDGLRRLADDYESKLKTDLPDGIGEAILSPLRFKQTNAFNQFNDFLKSFLNTSARDRVKKYESDLNQASSMIEESGLTFTGGQSDLQNALSFLHQHVKSHNLPFDVEMSQTYNPAYALARLLMNNNVLFKGSLHDANVRDDLREWHRINNTLNKMANSYQWPKAHFSFGGFLNTVGGDALALAVLLGLLSFVLSKKADLMRQQDQILGMSAEKAFEKMWTNNPWFDGEGYGNTPGARELTHRLLFDGVSPEVREELEKIRHQLTEEQNVVIDGVLALAADSPQDVAKATGQKLLSLIPFVGVPFAVISPAAFRQRQAMNKEIVNAVKTVSTVPEFLNQIKTIVAKYSRLEERSIDQNQEHVSFDEFSQEVNRLLSNPNLVATDDREIFSNRHNGSVAKGRGPVGEEFTGYRRYSVGDDLRGSKVDISGNRWVKEYQPDKEIQAGIMINLQGLMEQDKERAARDFVNSLKVLFKKMRVGSKNKGNYFLTQIKVLMPDGRMESLGINRGRNVSYQVLASQMLESMKDKYDQAKGFLVNQDGKKYVPNFYNLPQEIEGYLDRNNLGINQPATFLQRPSDTLRKDISLMNGQNVFLIGFNEVENHQVAGLLPRAKVYAWNQSRAVGVTVNRAMATNTGGIDFTANKTPLEIQNAGEGIKFHLDPAMLRQLQKAPGFVPVIINIQPMTNLRVFLGLNNETEGQTPLKHI